jgi:transposase
MDWLLQRQHKVEEGLARQHLQDGSLVLYDLTSTYFEGRKCPLARIGYSRDGKKNRLQIVFGLKTDAEGRPIAVEVFSGNTADPATLAHQVDTVRKRFGLTKVVLVADRGMITAARIREDLEPHGLEWITSLRGPAIRKLVEQEAIQLSLFDQCDLAEIEATSYPNERLIVCRNPLLAAERARKRQDLLAATERELEKIVQATTRENRPLRGAGAIGVRVGKVQNRFKMAKHFELQINEESFQYKRKNSSIEAESQLDGLYVIRTNVAVNTLPATQAVEAYKNLSQVERAFRRLKTSGLEVRPIFHRLEHRVRAHVFLCTLAYYVEWHLRQELAPLLFQDADPEAGAARRTSAVAPAQRSEAAEKKAHTQRTESGQRVHGFRDLLLALGSLTRNQVMTAAAPERSFVTYTQPTQLQQEAFDLLRLSPKM